MSNHPHVHGIAENGLTSVDTEHAAWIDRGDEPCLFCGLTADEDDAENGRRTFGASDYSDPFATDFGRARRQDSWSAPTTETEPEYRIRQAAWTVSEALGRSVTLFPGFGTIADGSTFGFVR